MTFIVWSKCTPLLTYFDIYGAKKRNMASRQACDWVHSSLLYLRLIDPPFHLNTKQEEIKEGYIQLAIWMFHIKLQMFQMGLLNAYTGVFSYY